MKQIKLGINDNITKQTYKSCKIMANRVTSYIYSILIVGSLNSNIIINNI